MKSQEEHGSSIPRRDWPSSMMSSSRPSSFRQPVFTGCKGCSYLAAANAARHMERLAHKQSQICMCQNFRSRSFCARAATLARSTSSWTPGFHSRSLLSLFTGEGVSGVFRTFSSPGTLPGGSYLQTTNVPSIGVLMFFCPFFPVGRVHLACAQPRRGLPNHLREGMRVCPCLPILMRVVGVIVTSGQVVPPMHDF